MQDVNFDHCLQDMSTNNGHNDSQQELANTMSESMRL